MTKYLSGPPILVERYKSNFRRHWPTIFAIFVIVFGALVLWRSIYPPQHEISVTALAESDNGADLQAFFRDRAFTEAVAEKAELTPSEVTRVFAQAQVSPEAPGVFVLALRHPDAQIARRILRAAAEGIAAAPADSMPLQRAQSQLLAAQLEGVNKKIDNTEAEIDAFIAAHIDPLTEESAKKDHWEEIIAERARLRDALIAARREAIVLRHRLSAENRIQAAERLQSIEAKLADLRLRYEDAHPEVQKTLEELSRMRNARDARESPNRLAIAAELSAVNEAIETFEGDSAKLSAQIIGKALSQTAEPQIAVAFQQLQTRRSSLQAMRDGISEAQLRLEISGVPSAAFHLVAAPHERRAAGLSAAQFIILAMGAAFIVGAAALAIFTALDMSILQLAELHHFFDEPVLGALSVVPSSKGQRGAP